MSALEIIWTTREGTHCRSHETKIGRQCLVAVDEWSFGRFDWRVTALDDRAAHSFTRIGAGVSLDAAKTLALAAVDGTIAGLRRALGPDLAAAIRAAQASVDQARSTYEQGEYAEPENVACSSLAQLADMVRQ